MSAIEERLQNAAVEHASGDWLDVIRRSVRLRRRTRRLRTIAAVVAVVLLGVPAFALADRLTELLVVSSTDEKIPMAWISGDRAYNVGGRNEVRLKAPLAGLVSDRYFSPSAVLSPDGTRLLYHSLDPPSTSLLYAQGVNVLRLHDLVTGEDRVFERGAQSIAWRADGAIAYSKSPEARSTRLGGGSSELGAELAREIGHVVVRQSLGAKPERWTEKPSDYTVIGWAGETLLVGAYVVPEESVQQLFGSSDQMHQGVYALDEPGNARKLPLGSVIALDPSGRLALGPATSNSPVDVVDTTGALLRVVRISDARVLSEFDLPALVTPERPYPYGSELSSGGSWAGEHIVVGYEVYTGDKSLVVLRFTDDKLTPAHIFKLDKKSAERAGVSSFYGPRFVDEVGRDIVGWATSPSSRFLLRCDRVKKRCSRSERLPRRSAGIPQIDGAPSLGTGRPEPLELHWPAFLIENPSRPLDE